MRSVRARIVELTLKIGVGSFGVAVAAILLTAAAVGAGTLAVRAGFGGVAALGAAGLVSALLIPLLLVFARFLSNTAKVAATRMDRIVEGPPSHSPKAGQLSRPDSKGDLSLPRE